jgi:hypothetical protein
MFTRCWRNHSLSIVLAVTGLGTYAIGYAIDELRLSDFFLNLGHGFFPLAVFNALAGQLREVNKPED